MRDTFSGYTIYIIAGIGKRGSGVLRQGGEEEVGGEGEGEGGGGGGGDFVWDWGGEGGVG